MSQVNLHESASTHFQGVGDVRLAYRRFGKEGASPLVCLQHFTGTMNNWDPVHANRLAQDRPWFSWTIDASVARLARHRTRWRTSRATSSPSFRRSADQVDLFGFSLGGMVAQQIALDVPKRERNAVKRPHQRRFSYLRKLNTFALSFEGACCAVAGRARRLTAGSCREYCQAAKTWSWLGAEDREHDPTACEAFA